MKTFVSILVVVLTACTRAETPPVSRHKDANVSGRTLRDENSESPDTREPAHVFPFAKGFGRLTAGAEPSPEHSAGTVYMLGGPPGAPSVTVAEWDLASGKEVHRAVLPQAAGEEARVVANDGGLLHLVNSGPDGQLYYTRLSPELKILSRTRMGEFASDDAKSIASDGRVTVIIGRYWMTDGVQGPWPASTYDNRGKLIAHRSLDSHGSNGLFAGTYEASAVLDGKVYLLLRQYTNDMESPRLVELTADLAPITSSVMPAPEGPRVPRLTLQPRGDRLVVDTPPAQYEFSRDLAEMKEIPRIPPPEPRFIGHAWCQEHVRVGPVDVFGCWNRETGEEFVAWDRYDGDP